MAKNRKFGALLLSAVFLTAFSTAVKAQSYYEEVPRTFYGGLLAGTNFTQVDGDNFAGYHKAGLNVGGIVYANFAPNFAGSIEILFSQRGSRAHQAQRGRTFVTQKYNIDLNYAEVPIMFNYFEKKKAHAGAGFSYSQLISSKESVLTTDPTVNAIDLNNEFPFKKYDINFLLGGGLRLYKGLFLNLRFQYSLVPVRKKENVHPDLGRAEQYNNSYVLRLMYLFGTEEPKY